MSSVLLPLITALNSLQQNTFMVHTLYNKKKVGFCCRWLCVIVTDDTELESFQMMSCCKEPLEQRSASMRFWLSFLAVAMQQFTLEMGWMSDLNICRTSGPSLSHIPFHIANATHFTSIPIESSNRIPAPLTRIPASHDW